MVQEELKWLEQKLWREDGGGYSSGMNDLLDSLTPSNVRDLAKMCVLAMVQSCDCLYSYAIVMATMAGFRINEYLAGIILQVALDLGYFLAPCFIKRCRYSRYEFVFKNGKITVYKFLLGVALTTYPLG